MVRDYNELDRQIQALRDEAEDLKDVMVAIGAKAQDVIDELEAIKQDSDEEEGEMQDHLANLEGLQACIEKADGVRDEAELQNIII